MHQADREHVKLTGIATKFINVLYLTVVDTFADVNGESCRSQ